MDSNMFAGMEKAFGCVVMTLVVSVPLGLWKLVEIVIWICRHTSIGVK